MIHEAFLLPQSPKDVAAYKTLLGKYQNTYETMKTVYKIFAIDPKWELSNNESAFIDNLLIAKQK